jgi:hypothetical protein
MRTPEYTNALFLNLHLPNGTHKKRVWSEVEKFLQKLAEYTGTHLHAIRGYEAEGLNSHEHACVRVPKDELERFNRRMRTFKPEDSKEYFCPKRYNRCREGKCDRIPAP